jgi:hypothetical protein
MCLTGKKCISSLLVSTSAGYQTYVFFSTLSSEGSRRKETPIHHIHHLLMLEGILSSHQIKAHFDKCSATAAHLREASYNKFFTKKKQT